MMMLAEEARGGRRGHNWLGWLCVLSSSVGQCGALRVAVVGGGPGGLTLAKALGDESRMQVTLFERSMDPLATSVGGGLQLSSGAAALKKVGVDVFEAAIPLRRVVSRDARGSKLLELDVSKALVDAGLAEPGKDGACAIMRSSLQRVLWDSMKNVDARLGATCVGAAPDGRLEWLEGGSDEARAETFDLIVGCDGVGSKVESAVFGDRSVKGSGIEVLFCVCDDSTRQDPNAFHQYLGDGAYVLSATYGSPGQPQDVLAVCTQGSDRPGSWDRDDPDLRRRATEAADAAGVAAVPELADGLQRAKRFYRAPVVFRAPRLPAWHKNRAVLLGDAAHAMPPFLGQGANQAVSDAVVLADCLKDPTMSLDQALRRYYSTRFLPTTRLLLNSRFLGFLETQSGPGAFGRDAFFRVTGALGIARAVFLDAATPRLGA